MTQSWFQNARPRRVPRLSDFLNLERAELILGETQGLHLENRVYDEKFHLLLSPALILPDLEFYRRACELRDKPVALAYFDIDDLKQFNSKYSEHVVDRDWLPKFMRAVEAHVYARGHAYRKGGDEYVILLPNMSDDEAVTCLFGVQQSLSTLHYQGIDEAPTVSIGLCVAEPECFLTNSEIESKANLAKQFAKDSGKNCVASYRGGLYRDEDRYVVQS